MYWEYGHSSSFYRPIDNGRGCGQYCNNDQHLSIIILAPILDWIDQDPYNFFFHSACCEMNLCTCSRQRSRLATFATATHYYIIIYFKSEAFCKCCWLLWVIILLYIEINKLIHKFKSIDLRSIGEYWYQDFLVVRGIEGFGQTLKLIQHDMGCKDKKSL